VKSQDREADDDHEDEDNHDHEDEDDRTTRGRMDEFGGWRTA
jgi:hypothetical protein